jgi:hypothetical protein
MNLLVVKVVAKHALLIGGIAAAATVVRDAYILNTKKSKK